MPVKFSPEQEKAASLFNGQVLVVACPGAGKTSVIIERAVRMVKSGIDPSSMLNITFTVAAAREMEERFRKRCNAPMKFSTIHSFCFSTLCREEGLSQDNILKNSEQWVFVSERLRGEVRNSEMEDVARKVISEISFVGNASLNIYAFVSEACDKELFRKIYVEYDRYKKSRNVIDMDDMLLRTRDRFRKDPAILKKYQSRYKYITIDEFQDTNKIQADIFYMLAGDNGNIYVVGDDDQSIYGFRAADSSIMLGFPKQFPNCTKVDMGTNYRCGSDIVEAAGNLIRHNKKRFDKDLVADRKESGDVSLITCESAEQQTKAVVAEIRSLLKKGLPPEEIAVLYRVNSASPAYIYQLLKKKVPYHVTEKPVSIHDTVPFDDIQAYYRLSINKGKPGDLQRILNHPARFLPGKLFEKCSFNAAELKAACHTGGNKDNMYRSKIDNLLFDLETLKRYVSPADFMSYMESAMGYRKWLNNYAEYTGKDKEELEEIWQSLLDESREYDTLPEWFSGAEQEDYLVQQNYRSRDKSGITLTTFHGAKGLEWKAVFIVNANKGVCPYRKAKTEAELEEERRMFYVAVTRAKDYLYFSYVDKGTKLPTPYLSEMGFQVFDPGKDENKGRKLGEHGLAG